MTEGRDGRIVTFYSYKGGTGRTMALANVCWILAANGKRVLAMDWDLEAPGLHRFFHPFLDPGVLDATTGVIDMIGDYVWAVTDGRRHTGPWHLLRPDPAPRRLRGVGLPGRRLPRPRLGRTAHQHLLRPGHHLRLGQLLRAARRRAVPGRHARRHETALRLRPPRQPHRPERHRRHLHSPPATCSWTASPSATRASTVPRPSPARSAGATANAASVSCPSPCASTRARRTGRTRDAHWRG